jgi:phosphatidylserine synthase
LEQAVVTQAGSRPAAGVPCGACPGRTWLKASFGERVLQAAVAAVLLAALVLGFALAPSPTGMGTHTGLGLTPCGMLVMTGHPCPTCGVTTSFVLAAHGRFGEALVNQPFGLAVFVCVAGGLLLSGFTLAAGRSWLPLVTVNRVLATVIILAVIAAVSWGYKWAQV